MELATLKRQRQALGLTQKQFADACGLSQSIIAKIESGALDPKYSTVLRIEEGIGKLSKRKERTLADIVNRKTISCQASEGIPHLIKRMQAAGISQVPVLKGEQVVGLVTERRLLHVIADGGDIAAHTASDLMEDAPPLLPASTPVANASKLLEFSPLLLVTRAGHIIGVVTSADLLKDAL